MKGKKIPGRFRPLAFLLLPVGAATEQSVPARWKTNFRGFRRRAAEFSFIPPPSPVSRMQFRARLPFPPLSLVVNFQDDAHKIQQLCAQLCGFGGHFGGERDGGEAPKMRERGIPRREEGEEKGGAGVPPRETRRSIRLINSLICPPTRALRCAGRALDRITV